MISREDDAKLKQRYNYLDLSGRKFGRLTCIKDVGRAKGSNVLWLCKCECGNESIVRSGKLMNGHTQSCGCLQKERCITTHTTHSLSRDQKGNRSKLYHVWDGIKQRCSNPKSTFYQDYGGRGILVCEEWNDYPNFHEWATGNGYREGLTIERKDVNKGYSPDNCCWITRLQQSRNKRNSCKLTFRGKTKLLIDWAQEIGVDSAALRLRMKRGWSVEKTLTQPLRITSRRKSDEGNTVTKSIS